MGNLDPLTLDIAYRYKKYQLDDFERLATVFYHRISAQRVRRQRRYSISGRKSCVRFALGVRPHFIAHACERNPLPSPGILLVYAQLQRTNHCAALCDKALEIKQPAVATLPSILCTYQMRSLGDDIASLESINVRAVA